jgi:flagellar L-ring protein precursor FlgH
MGIVVVTSSALADLPGLPAPAPQSSEPAGGSKPTNGTTATPSNGDAKPVQAAPTAPAPQTGPVRGSLFKQAAATPMVVDGQGGAGRSVGVSFIAVQPAQPRKYHKNDLLTVIIREDSDSSTNGKGKANKSQDFDFALEQFIQLAVAQSGLPTIETVKTPSRLPAIKFKYENNRESDADQERQDSFSARISATVVDVKPNGTMVIEAVKQIIVEKEEQVFRLSGICRVEDIAVDNTILSTQLADLALSKQTKGNVFDGTKRGWLNQMIDRVSPF